MKKYSRIIALLLAVVLVLPGAGLVTQANTTLATPNVERLSGDTRVETAVAVSKAAYTTADTVILAGYAGGVDALTATPLAAKLNAPVLFTEAGKLNAETKAEIVRLGAKTVHILGGEKVVSKEVFELVDALEGVTAKRIEGKDRYETAAAVATILASTTKHAFVALGTEVKGMFPDALAVGPAAAKLDSPVLLTQAGKLPEAVKTALTGFEKVTIVGGNQAITPAVVTALTGMGIVVDRVEGANREATALQIATKYFAGSDKAVLANGYKGADALIGGYFAAKHGAPILLVQETKVHADVQAYVTANVNMAYVLGGTTVVADTVVTSVNTLINDAVLKVVSVKVTNLKEVEVKFSKMVDKKLAEKTENYKVYNGGATTDLVAGGTAKLKDDGMTLVINLATPFNNGTLGKIVVKNIVEYTNDSVLVSDTTVPTVVGIEVTGPKTFTVEYSEPIRNANVAEYTVDNGNYIVSSVANNGSHKVDVTVGVNFTNGEHTVKINGTHVDDYAGYKVITTTKTFTVAADTQAPKVTIKSVTPKQIKLVFDKPVTNVSDANVKYRHTFNNDTYSYTGDVADVDSVTPGNQAFVTAVSSTEYTLDFSQKPVALGNNTLYISYVSATGTMIEDLWGNKLPVTALSLNVELDTVKPAVTEVKFVDASTLKVIFSEELDKTSAEVALNYEVKDSAGDKLILNTAVLGTTNKNEVTLNFVSNSLAGGKYNVLIKNVKDIAFVPNTMDSFATTLTINDTVRPTVLGSKKAISGTQAKLYIPFSEQMDAATLTKNNFIVDIDGVTDIERALGVNDTIVIAPDAKSVVITINHADAINDILTVTVGNVKDLAGNTFASIISVSGPDFALSADAVAIEKVEAVGTKKLKVTFDGRLSTISATGYSLAQNSDQSAVVIPMSVTSHTVDPKTNKSIVEFALGTAISADATLATEKLDLVVNGATGTKSYLGTVVTNFASANTAQANDVLDKIAPSLLNVTVDSANQITLTFTEELEADTFAATLNGFTVAGGNSKVTAVAITGGTDSTTVVLTGTGFVSGTTTVSYNEIAGITDVAGNTLSSFADKK